MAYKRQDVQDNVTIMCKALYDNLQDGIDEALQTVRGVDDGAGAHNSVYRGKYLGTSVTNEQYAEISAGTFNDMYIGDYWTIDGITYRIAAFDYWYNANEGRAKCTKHHVTLIPDEPMESCKMCESDHMTDTTAYMTADIISTVVSNHDSVTCHTIYEAFAGHVLAHERYLPNAAYNGKNAGYSYYNSAVELMSISEVAGLDIVSENSGVTSNPHGQYPLFRLNPKMVYSTVDNVWLMDRYGHGQFAIIDSSMGIIRQEDAYLNVGIRPTFSIY